MFLIYKQYKYSKTATLLDLFGNGFILIGAILAITSVTEIRGAADLAETLGVFFAAAVIAAIGVGIKKYAKKLAEKKKAKIFGQANNQTVEKEKTVKLKKEKNSDQKNDKIKKIVITVIIVCLCYAGGKAIGAKVAQKDILDAPEAPELEDILVKPEEIDDEDDEDALNQYVKNDFYSTYIETKDFESGIDFLNSEREKASLPEEIISDLEKLLALSKIQSMMEEEDWKGLGDYFSASTDYMQISGITYFQNGEICEMIESGKGMILSSTGVYYGDIQYGQRSGEGCQFGIWGYGEDNYCTVKGLWSNDEANGECVYTRYNELVGSDYYDFTYEGNITSNLFDGKILYTWENRETNDKDEAAFMANSGTISYLRKTDEGYVYAESSSGLYWYMYEEQGLENNGIWCDYTH